MKTFAEFIAESFWKDWGIIDENGKVIEGTPSQKNHDGLAQTMGYKDSNVAVNAGCVRFFYDHGMFNADVTPTNRSAFEHLVDYMFHNKAKNPFQVTIDHSQSFHNRSALRGYPLYQREYRGFDAAIEAIQTHLETI